MAGKGYPNTPNATVTGSWSPEHQNGICYWSVYYNGERQEASVERNKEEINMFGIVMRLNRKPR